MNFSIVIPARWESSRLPGKPLADVNGRPLIALVHDLALESGAARVVIATDDARIRDAAASFGAEACMTSADHPTGTDRVNEVAGVLGLGDDDIVLNLQADEPFLPVALLRQVVSALVADPGAGIATAATPVRSTSEAHAPSVVKVVCDTHGRALYFSRAPIPWDRAGEGRDHAAMLRHIGIYAYRVSTLKRLSSLPPAPLERLESLEQLRALHNGIAITVAVTDDTPPGGIDTLEDLERVRELLR